MCDGAVETDEDDDEDVVGLRRQTAGREGPAAASSSNDVLEALTSSQVRRWMWREREKMLICLTGRRSAEEKEVRGGGEAAEGEAAGEVRMEGRMKEVSLCVCAGRPMRSQLRWRV